MVEKAAPSSGITTLAMLKTAETKAGNAKSVRGRRSVIYDVLHCMK